jgi:phasin
MSVMTTAARNYTSKSTDGPQVMREVAEKSTAQARENFEKLSAASGEASEAMRTAYLTAMKGAQNYSAKVIEFAQANADATFAFAKELSRVKSPSEFIELSSEHTRQQFEVLTQQAKDLAELAQKVTVESAEPFKAGVAKAFNPGV